MDELAAVEKKLGVGDAPELLEGSDIDRKVSASVLC